MNSDDKHSLQVLKKFRIIYGSVRQHFREVEQTCGVSGSQLWIMQEVAHKPGIGVSELAERLSIHQSTCSLLVEKLVVRELLVKLKGEQDKRRVGLHVTKVAARLIKNAPGPAEGILPKALASLSGEELQSLDQALEQVIKSLQVDGETLAERLLSDL